MILYELGEYDEETLTLKLSEIRAEQGRLREQATALRGRDDAERCRVELFDMLTTWDEANEAAGQPLRADRGARRRSRARHEVPNEAGGLTPSRGSSPTTATRSSGSARTTAPSASPRGTSGPRTARRSTLPGSSKTWAWRSPARHGRRWVR